MPAPTLGFAAFIESLGLNFFNAREISDLGGGEPPRYLWDNIIPTIVIADELREELRRPIKITSAYRDPDYNADVGGAKASLHQAFNALDLKPLGGATAEEVYQILLRWRRAGTVFKVPFAGLSRVVPPAPAPIPLRHLEWSSPVEFVFKGGLGLYRSFVHLDTRGYNATWRIL